MTCVSWGSPLSSLARRRRRARPTTSIFKVSEDRMARPSQERKRRIAAPADADAAPAQRHSEPDQGSSGAERSVFAVELTEETSLTEAGDPTAVFELSDVEPTELTFTAEGETELPRGLHLVSSEAAAALPSPVLLGSAPAPLAAGLAGTPNADLAGTAIEGKLRGNLDYADWSGIKGGSGIRPNLRSASRSSCWTATICWRGCWRANTATISRMPGSATGGTASRSDSAKR